MKLEQQTNQDEHTFVPAAERPYSGPPAHRSCLPLHRLPRKSSLQKVPSHYQDPETAQDRHRPPPHVVLAPLYAFELD